MEPKLRIIRKKKSEAENAHLDPLMRALKALHSAGAPESMTAEELERQRRSQEVLGKLTAPMTGMDYEEFALSGMSAAWTRLKAPHGSRHAILYCHGGGYTSGNLGYSRVLSSKLAHATGYDVLSFEYRLAPEFPYPAAVEDALRAWAARAISSSRATARAATSPLCSATASRRRAASSPARSS